ncbi:MAG: Signal transduction histidine kinase [Modestobacter sp.]|nr:Signal transduction histidine kinase [Modestobacter sp.]
MSASADPGRSRVRSPVGPWWSRLGVRVRATTAAVLVVAVALLLASAVLVALVNRTVRETVTSAVLTRAQEVAADLAGDAGAAQLGGSDDGVLIQVVSGDRVLAASPGLAGLSPLTPARPAPGATVTASVDGGTLGENGDNYRLVAVGVGPSTGADRVIAVQSLAVAENTAALVERLAAIGIPVLLVVVGAATWSSVGRALHPVEAIRSRTAQIQAADLSARVPVPATHDEIASLATTMNAMLGRLEASARAQRAFVSDAGHEMRSPVAAIRTEVEVAQRAGVGEWTLSDVLSETGRLERLVDDLLVLARADEAQVPLHRVDVDVDHVVEAERPRLLDRGLAVTTSIAAARVVGDPAALGRVVRNLADNAARHASGRVHLACGRDAAVPGAVWIEISDDGPGIPAADRERVFDRFVRLDEARARDDGGSGLGLAIVRGLVTAHGGRVCVQDGSVLPGALVRVWLPAQPPSGANR